MTKAGNLDRRITIQRATKINNEFNEPIETWADLATVWRVGVTSAMGRKSGPDRSGRR